MILIADHEKKNITENAGRKRYEGHFNETML